MRVVIAALTGRRVVGIPLPRVPSLRYRSETLPWAMNSCPFGAQGRISHSPFRARLGDTRLLHLPRNLTKI